MNNNHPAALETTQKMTLCNTFSLFTTRLSFHPPLSSAAMSRPPSLYFQSCVSLAFPVEPFSGLSCLPGRFDKHHTPTCLLFSINEINHEDRHHVPLSPVCPLAPEKRHRETQGDAMSGPVES